MRTNSKRDVGTLLLLLVSIQNVAASGPPEPEAQRVPSLPAVRDWDVSIAAKRRELGIPGCALAVVWHDRVVYEQGFGLRDVQHNKPVTPATLFAIGSCTKAFTGLLAALAAGEGRLSLDDAPVKYLPYFHLHGPNAVPPVTLRDLLCHRSGVGSGAGELAWMSGVLRRKEVIETACQVPPAFRAGERFQYNSVLFAAAGEAVARAQHTTWEHLVRERLFRPLHMTASCFAREEMQRSPDFALGYAPDDEVKKATVMPMADMSATGPAGGIDSNLQDMSQWLRLMLGKGVYQGKRLISSQCFAEVVRPQIHVWAGQDYGLGWGVPKDEWNGQAGLWHNGSVPGFYAEVRLLPGQELGYVLLCNVPASRQARSLASFVREKVWSGCVGPSSLPASLPTVASPSNVAPPFVSALTVEELRTKMLFALGGEANLRRLPRFTQTFTFTVPEQGVHGTGTRIQGAPVCLRMRRTLQARGKTLGTIEDYCDTTRAGTRRHLGLLPSETYTGTALASRQTAAQWHDVLDWSALYTKVEIVGMEKVEGEEVYVVRKTPPQGEPVEDWVSTQTYLIRKRHDATGNTLFRRYARWQSVLLPTEWTQEDDYLGVSLIQVTGTK